MDNTREEQYRKLLAVAIGLIKVELFTGMKPIDTLSQLGLTMEDVANMSNEELQKLLDTLENLSSF